MVARPVEGRDLEGGGSPPPVVLYIFVCFRFVFGLLCLKEPSVDVGFPIHFPEVPDSRRGETDPHSFHTAGRSFVFVCSYVFVFLSAFVLFVFVVAMVALRG